MSASIARCRTGWQHFLPGTTYQWEPGKSAASSAKYRVYPSGGEPMAQTRRTIPVLSTVRRCRGRTLKPLNYSDHWCNWAAAHINLLPDHHDQYQVHASREFII